MKTPFISMITILTATLSYSQIDTISENIYQNEGRLGIGINTPDYLLDIRDDAGQYDPNPRQFIFLHNINNSVHSNVAIAMRSGTDDNESQASFGLTSNFYSAIPGLAGFAYIYNVNNGIALRATNPNGVIRMFTGGDNIENERMRISEKGYVGIGIINPLEVLDLNGGLKLDNTFNTNPGTLRWTGSDFEGYNGSEWKSLTQTQTGLWQSSGNNLYYNEGNIGLGTSDPEHALTIEGNEDEWPGRIFLSIKNTSVSNKSLAYLKIYSGESGNGTSLGHISNTYTATGFPEEVQDFGRLTSSGNGLMIDATKSNQEAGVIKFCGGKDINDSFVERMRIDTSGNIGIGTTQPVAKVQIADGDIYISDTEKGIIMKSPDGGCWRGTLDSSGNLNFVSIDCPDSEGTSEIPPNNTVTSNINIYPNPAQNTVTINCTLSSEKLFLKVFTNDGKLMDKSLITNEYFVRDISKFKPGIYIFQIEDREGNIKAAEKIVKE